MHQKLTQDNLSLTKEAIMGFNYTAGGVNYASETVILNLFKITFRFYYKFFNLKWVLVNIVAHNSSRAPGGLKQAA